MHFRPVKLQGVRLNQLKCLRENASQPGGKITVNLNRRFVSALREKKLAEAVTNWQRELRDKAYVEIRQVGN